MPSVRQGGMYIVLRLVSYCVVGVSELWERFVLYVEAGLALLHSLGFCCVVFYVFMYRSGRVGRVPAILMCALFFLSCSHIFNIWQGW